MKIGAIRKKYEDENQGKVIQIVYYDNTDAEIIIEPDEDYLTLRICSPY